MAQGIGQSRIGAERIRLLEVIAEHGSISAAARVLDLSYKGAWDAVQALNNLFERPLVTAQIGGRAGGSATVTPAGPRGNPRLPQGGERSCRTSSSNSSMACRTARCRSKTSSGASA